MEAAQYEVDDGHRQDGSDEADQRQDHHLAPLQLPCKLQDECDDIDGPDRDGSDQLRVAVTEGRQQTGEIDKRQHNGDCQEDDADDEDDDEEEEDDAEDDDDTVEINNVGGGGGVGADKEDLLLVAEVAVVAAVVLRRKIGQHACFHNPLVSGWLVLWVH